VGLGMAERKPAASGIEVTIPGRRRLLRISHAVFGFNGTLATDGRLIRGVGTRMKRLAAVVDAVVTMADTFGTARRALHGLPVTAQKTPQYHTLRYTTRPVRAGQEFKR